MSNIDFNNPVVVDIVITSPVVDFNIPTYGWVNRITLQQLPPYDTTREKVLADIAETLNTVGVVPYDNLAGYEDLLAIAEADLNHCINVVKAELQDKDEGYCTNPDTDTKLTVSVRISQRVDTPEIKAIFNAE